mmetsp:Transcript_22387/g.39843  ORF Transcript_22387/g.39843 Transcript_22387/m.39843 type:complete len:235 (-) Transcript_22387:64-768(-)
MPLRVSELLRPWLESAADRHVPELHHARGGHFLDSDSSTAAPWMLGVCPGVRSQAMRRHTEFLDIGEKASSNLVSSFAPSTQAVGVAEDAAGGGGGDAADGGGGGDAAGGGSGDGESVLSVADERANIAQQVAAEAEEAASDAENADSAISDLEYAVLWLNVVLSGVVFGGVYIAWRGYTTWLERKKELGRAWMVVKQYEATGGLGMSSASSSLSGGDSGAGQGNRPPTETEIL